VAGQSHPRGLVVAVVLVGAFASSVTITILTIAISAIAVDLGTSVADTAWVLLAPIVLSALAAPSTGRAADRYGRKRMWLVGFAIAGAGIVGSAVAWSLPVLIAARVLTGVGTALALPAGLAIAVAEYEPARQSLPIGWWTSVTALAPAAGVLIGGFAVEHLSWRWLFYGQLPFVIAAFGLGAVVFRETRGPRNGRFDIEGAILGGAAVFGFLLVINRGSSWGWRSPATIGCALLSAIAAPWFVRVQRRAVQPIVPIKLLAIPAVRWALLNRVFVNAAYMGSFIILPVLLMEVGGWGAATVALALSPRPIAMGLAGPTAGWLAVRFGPERLVVVGSLLLTAGVSYLAFLAPGAPYVFLLLALVAMGIGLGAGSTAASAIVTASTEASELGTTSGFLAVAASVANSLGMATLLAVVAAAGGERSQTSFHWAFGAGAIIAALGAWSAIMLARARRLHAVTR